LNDAENNCVLVYKGLE